MLRHERRTPAARKVAHRRHTAFCPGLESLEDRLAPAVALTYAGSFAALTLTVSP